MKARGKRRRSAAPGSHQHTCRALKGRNTAYIYVGPTGLMAHTFHLSKLSLYTLPRAWYSQLRTLQEVLLMGTKGRPKPANLSRKLRQIRIFLGVSQSEMIRRLGFEDSM